MRDSKGRVIVRRPIELRDYLEWLDMILRTEGTGVGQLKLEHFELCDVKDDGPTSEWLDYQDTIRREYGVGLKAMNADGTWREWSPREMQT